MSYLWQSQDEPSSIKTVPGQYLLFEDYNDDVGKHCIVAQVTDELGHYGVIAQTKEWHTAELLFNSLNSRY